MAERQAPAIPGSCPPSSYRSLFIHSRPPRQRALLPAYAGGAFVNGPGKTNVCFAAACFLLGSLYLIVFLVTFSYSEGKSLTCHFIAFQILIVGSDLIDQLTINDLHDTVGSGLYDLVVTG